MERLREEVRHWSHYQPGGGEDGKTFWRPYSPLMSDEEILRHVADHLERHVSMARPRR